MWRQIEVEDTVSGVLVPGHKDLNQIALGNLTILFIIHWISFQNLQMLRRNKNREIVYDLWSFVFFNLEAE